MPSHITHLAGTGASGYFADENGQPRFGLADNPWGIIPNAGRWEGTWQSVLDAYFDARGEQGFTAIYLSPYGNTINGGAYGDGRTWDGIYPFNSGADNDPSSGLHEEYFTRIDYAITAAARNGITLVINIAYAGGAGEDMDSPGCLYGKTNQQYTDYGTALAARYKDTPNLIWAVGNDYFDGYQTPYTLIKDALRTGGDAHVFMVHNMPESTARFTLDTAAVQNTGTALSEVNFVYTYNCSYFGIEQAYAEANPLPVIYGDGYFYQGSSSSYTELYDRAARQEVWWAVASGARYYNFGGDLIWDWQSGASAVANAYYYATQAGRIRSVLESLDNWHKLVPATGTTLITAGRGTRCTSLASGGGALPYEPATSNNYVAASLAPGGSLALMYLPAATTITVDTTKLGAGWGSKWIDPVTGAATAAGGGPTFNSTAKGNNSAGDPDWVLALAQPPYATWAVP